MVRSGAEAEGIARYTVALVAAASKYFSQSLIRTRQIRLDSLVARRRPLLISISRNRRQTPAAAAHSGNPIMRGSPLFGMAIVVVSVLEGIVSGVRLTFNRKHVTPKVICWSFSVVP